MTRTNGDWRIVYGSDLAWGGRTFLIDDAARRRLNKAWQKRVYVQPLPAEEPGLGVTRLALYADAEHRVFLGVATRNEDPDSTHT